VKGQNRAESAYKKAISGKINEVKKPEFPAFEAVIENSSKVEKSENLKSNDKVSSSASNNEALKLQNLKKVAKFIKLLGKKEAQKVLQHLPKESIEIINQMLKEIPYIEPVEAEALLKEFGLVAQKAPSLAGGGQKLAQDMLEKAFGAEKAKKIVSKVLPESKTSPFEFMKEYELHQLKLLLGGESILVLSMVLPHLDKKKAADYIATLPAETRLLLIKRMARVEKVSNEVVRRVELALQEKAHQIGAQESMAFDGKARLSEILRNLNPQDAESLLSELEETDPELAQSLRNRLFTQERILQIRDVDFEVFLRDIPDEDLALVVQSLPEQSAQKILSNVSERRQMWIKDEIELMGKVSKIELVAAQREFLSKVRKALANGELRYEENENEEYL